MTASSPFARCLFMVFLMPPSLLGLDTDCDPQFHGGELSKQQQYECLVSELFDPNKYSPLVRPVQNINDTIEVEMSVQLSQIINLDEKNQVMKTNVWLQLYWYDYQLMWNKTGNYKDIEKISIKPDSVWIPDVVLFNNADGNYEVSYRSNVLVYHNTYMNWIPPAIYKSSCNIDVQFFPFDEQVCDMKFGSWTFMEDQFKFKFYQDVSHLDVTDYLVNGAWDIVSGNAELQSVRTGNANKSKAMIIFKLVLRRKTLFYTVNLIIPCVLISFVTISVFILPADAGEKITLCISILLALVVFLLLISKILPPSLTIPLVSQYLLFTFIMNILAILSTVVVINRNYRTPRTHQMPHWVRLLFLNYLPKILFMTRPDHEERWRGMDSDPQPAPPQPPWSTHNFQIPRSQNRDPDLTHSTNMVLAQRNVQIAAQLGADVTDERSLETHHPNCRLNNLAAMTTEDQTASSSSTNETSFTDPPYKHVSFEIYRAAESLKFIYKHLKKDDEYQTIIEDWRYVARVIDRLLLYIFLIVTIAGSVGLFMKAPHIFESVDPNILKKMTAAWDKAKGA